MKKLIAVTIMILFISVSIIPSTGSLLSFDDVALPITTHSLNPPEEEWNKTYGGMGEDWSYDVQQTNDGGYILVGYTRSQGSDYEDIWLVKTDVNGTMVWNNTFGGHTQDKGYSVQQTNDDGYILVGHTFSYGYGSCDVWLIKTDENGNEQWNKTHGNVQADAGRSVRQTSDGGYIITGYTRSYGYGNAGDIWVIKTNENGKELWNCTWGGPYTGASEEGFSIEQTPDGGYILTGCYFDVSVFGYDVILLKTDENGTEEWNRTWGGRNTDYGTCVRGTSDGGYIISGVMGGNKADAWLIKTDINGTEQWNRSFGGNGFDRAESVYQTDYSGYILTGLTTNKSGLDRDLLLIETDRYGNKIWNNTYGTKENGEMGYSVQQTFDGGYAIAGYTYSYGAGKGDFWLIKVASWNDTTLPVTSHSVNPPEPDGDNGYYVNDVEVTLNATDNESGVKEIRYRIDSGSWQLITGDKGTFIMNIDGNDVLIEYYAIDNAGNEEDRKSFTIDMDQAIPVAEDITWEAYQDEDGWWYIDFTASATDATSDMEMVVLFVEDNHHETIRGPGPDYVFTIKWSNEFWYKTLYFHHYDRAGNEVIVELCVGPPPDPPPICLLIGIIRNPEITEDNVSFFAILVFYTGFPFPIINENMTLTDNYIGYIGKHFICVLF